MVVRAQRVGETHKAPLEVAATGRPDAGAFGNGQGHVHHDSDLGVPMEKLASNFAGFMGISRGRVLPERAARARHWICCFSGALNVIQFWRFSRSTRLRLKGTTAAGL